MTAFNDFNIGDNVCVLNSTLNIDNHLTHTFFFRTRVVAKHKSQHGYKYQVTLPDGEFSKRLSKYQIFSEIGVMILEIGDLKSETYLLDPLFNGIVSYFKLLLPGDELEAHKIRTQFEFEEIWKLHHAKISHVIIIGHGSSDSISFFNEVKLTSSDLVQIIDKYYDINSHSKFFLSLCCHTGHRNFGHIFSKAKFCKQFYGPIDSIYGPYAMLYCQLFFTTSLLTNDNTTFALFKSNSNLNFMPKFESWMHGKESIKYSIASKHKPINLPSENYIT